MIARIWTARAATARAAEYTAYFEATVLAELNAIHGYEGATLLRRDQGDQVELTVITWWTSLEAVRAFAGEAIETAVVHDTAARMLIDFDRAVKHHDVVVNRPRAERQADQNPRRG